MRVKVFFFFFSTIMVMPSLHRLTKKQWWLSSEGIGHSMKMDVASILPGGDKHQTFFSQKNTL